MAVVAGDGTRKDTFRVSLVVNDEDWGTWDTKSGGKLDSDRTVHRPGGMGKRKSLGGLPNTDDITLTRNYEYIRDHQNAQRLFNMAGKGKAVVKQLPLDVDGVAFGRPVVWTGTLKSVDIPEHDSNSTDAAFITLEITPDDSPTAI